MKKGFTLIEMLVVIAVLSIAGFLVLTIFSNALRGNNKSQILSSIKKNGQSVLEALDKNIRNSDNVVCITPSGDTIVLVKEGIYTRFRYIPANNTNTATAYGNCGSNNGCILKAFPIQPQPPAENSIIQTFINNVCTDPMGSDSTTPQVLTDTDEQTGVSIQQSSTNIFTRNQAAGFKETVTVRFKAAPPVGAPSSVSGQIDPVEFATTVGLR